MDVLGAVLEGRYRVDALLARGGMSSVYSGVDLRLDRPVAIKVMESKFARDREFIERFELEARAAARLHHPNVVAVHDQGVDGDHVYLVMELVSGGTLRDLVRERGLLAVPLAISVLDPVLSALTSAHRAGLVHRDVKPENVLIGRGGTSGGGIVKVADFGLVRAVGTMGITSDATILGTVAYLSPEQVADGTADARSDVYAAGIVCYELLTGKPPFVGENAVSVAYRHVNDDVPPPSEAAPGVPAALDDLVLRATRRDPALRPSDAAAFLDELIRTRNSLGLHRMPVPVPAPRRPAPPSDAEPPNGRHRAENVATMIATPPTEIATPVPAPTPAEVTTKVDPSALATIRTLPVAPGSLGPQGTMAINRRQAYGGVGTAQQQPRQRRNTPPRRDSYEAQRQRGRRTMLIWVAVVLVLAAVLGAAAWWFGSGRWTSVPRISGQDPTTAERTLQNADLSAAITQAHNDSVPAGEVVSTDPAFGSRALRGSTITVVVSEGKPIVPDVTPGASPAAVEQAVRKAQLTPKLDAAQNQYSPTVPSGAVVGLNPPPGTQVDIGAPIVVVVSKGPPPNPVPNVVGQPHDQAFAALTQAGFAPFDEPSTFAANVPAGTVISTNPAAGAVPGAAGNKVGVQVSNAVTVPNLQGQQAQQAQSTLQGMGLQAQIQAFAGDPNGQVFTQSPAAGTLVAPGTTVTLGVFP